LLVVSVHMIGYIIETIQGRTRGELKKIAGYRTRAMQKNEIFSLFADPKYSAKRSRPQFALLLYRLACAS